MPSLEHEVLVEVLRDFPELVRDLLAPRLDAELAAEPGRVVEADFTQILPAEFRADGLIVFGEPPRYGFVVEVQLRRDNRKRRSWPLYAAAAHAKLDCAVWLVVVAPDHRVATWASRPIATFQPGCNFAPKVLGPEDVPRITDPVQALASPGVALLSGFVHGRHPAGIDEAIAAIEALAVLDDERARVYFHFFQGVMEEAVFAAVEAHMETRNIPYRIPFARKAFEEGRQEGRQEARLETLRSAVLEVVRVRLGEVSAEIEQRIASCGEVEILQRWHRGVAGAADDAALLAVLGD